MNKTSKSQSTCQEYFYSTFAKHLVYVSLIHFSAHCHPTTTTSSLSHTIKQHNSLALSKDSQIHLPVLAHLIVNALLFNLCNFIFFPNATSWPGAERNGLDTLCEMPHKLVSFRGAGGSVSAVFIFFLQNVNLSFLKWVSCVMKHS